MKAWIVERHGGLEALRRIERPAPIPGADQARVAVRAVGLNHLDIWVRKGVPGHAFPLPMVPGCDVAGTLESVGPLSPGTRPGVAKGDRVLVNPILSCGKCKSCLAGFAPTCPDFGLLGETQDGGCAEFVVVPIRNLLKIPNGVSLTQAACLPIAYVTAWSMLTRKARVQPGELVLIQAGGSGVSVAAIQIAKNLGATVVTTVGSEEKERRALALGADHVIQYREKPFREEMKSLLKKLSRRGVDVAIDHVGVATFQDSLRSLDRGGRLVFCGATTGALVEIDLKPIFFKNLSVLGSTMGGQEDLAIVLDLVAKGKIKAIIDSEIPMAELPRAQSRLEDRLGFGKVILTP